MDIEWYRIMLINVYWQWQDKLRYDRYELAGWGGTVRSKTDCSGADWRGCSWLGRWKHRAGTGCPWILGQSSLDSHVLLIFLKSSKSKRLSNATWWMRRVNTSWDMLDCPERSGQMCRWQILQFKRLVFSWSSHIITIHLNLGGVSIPEPKCLRQCRLRP